MSNTSFVRALGNGEYELVPESDPLAKKLRLAKKKIYADMRVKATEIIKLVEKAQGLAKEYDKKYGCGKEVMKIDLVVHSKKL